MKLSGCKAIAEKREGKNQETIFSFERSGRDWGHRWKEGRKVETAAGKKFDWLCSVSFLFGSLKSGNSLPQMGRASTAITVFIRLIKHHQH